MNNDVGARLITRRPLPYLLLLMVLVPLFTKAQSQLSPQAKVSLITVGPGDELYSSFGHSALWIYDPVYQLDRAYSYGTFSFQEGNFYVKFLRGTLPYTISVNPLMPQFYYWQQENRSVKEQELNLSLPEKQRLYDFLETNLLPQNREYQYKFFYDNCSTRLADAVKAAMGDRLIFPGYVHETLSFRQWIDRYAYEQKPWSDFGMDLAIGSPSDEVATPEQATFLPDNLSAAFADAKIQTDSLEVPLVMDTRELYTATPEVERGWLTPKIFFWVLAVLIAAFTIWQIKTERLNFVLDKILFTVVGLTGWLILGLWFGTNHGVTEWNWDILWAFPLWVPIVFMFSKTKKPAWFSWYLIAYGVMLLAATGNLLKHNYVLIPILLILVLRVYYLNNSLEKIPSS
ncbi:DUF4105 domain-containing protein [Persicitalea sp.]|uniref:lipoprotein N-acyltransferase Lnb domain-containing protein n=1 Tax=Persicitalea sp. TaxID=3100273 RepID=UPI003593ABD6